MTDSINDVKVGEFVSDEMKKKLATDNAKASNEAQALAAEHRRQDMATGGPTKTNEQILAEQIKAKLERGEIQEGKVHMKV